MAGTTAACLNVNTGAVLPLSTAASITVPANTLAAGVYEFTVIVSKPNRISAVKTATFTVSNVVVPVVTVTLLGAASLVNINDDDKLIATASVTSSVAIVSSSWQIVSGPIVTGTIANQQTSATSLTSNYFLNEFRTPLFWNPGSIYTIRYTAANVFGAVGFADVSVTINQPPHGGAIVVTPTTGTELVTSFSLSATKFIGASAASVLDYRWFYVSPSSATTDVPIGAVPGNALDQATLPRGTISIGVVITDSITGSATTVMLATPITVVANSNYDLSSSSGITNLNSLIGNTIAATLASNDGRAFAQFLLSMLALLTASQPTATAGTVNGRRLLGLPTALTKSSGPVTDTTSSLAYALVASVHSTPSDAVVTSCNSLTTTRAFTPESWAPVYAACIKNTAIVVAAFKTVCSGAGAAKCQANIETTLEKLLHMQLGSMSILGTFASELVAAPTTQSRRLLADSVYPSVNNASDTLATTEQLFTDLSSLFASYSQLVLTVAGQGRTFADAGYVAVIERDLITDQVEYTFNTVDNTTVTFASGWDQSGLMNVANTFIDTRMVFFTLNLFAFDSQNVTFLSDIFHTNRTNSTGALLQSATPSLLPAISVTFPVPVMVPTAYIVCMQWDWVSDMWLVNNSYAMMNTSVSADGSMVTCQVSGVVTVTMAVFVVIPAAPIMVVSSTAASSSLSSSTAGAIASSSGSATSAASSSTGSAAGPTTSSSSAAGATPSSSSTGSSVASSTGPASPFVPPVGAVVVSGFQLSNYDYTTATNFATQFAADLSSISGVDSSRFTQIAAAKSGANSLVTFVILPPTAATNQPDAITVLLSIKSAVLAAQVTSSSVVSHAAPSAASNLAYVNYCADGSQSSNTACAPTPAASSGSGSSGLSGGAIAGIVIGSVAFVLIVLVVLIRRASSRRHQMLVVDRSTSPLAQVNFSDGAGPIQVNRLKPGNGNGNGTVDEE